METAHRVGTAAFGGDSVYRSGAPRPMKMGLLVLHSAMIMEPALHSNLRYCDGLRFRATPHPGGSRLRRTSFAAAALRLTGSRPESSCQTTLIGITGSCIVPTRYG